MFNRQRHRKCRRGAASRLISSHHWSVQLPSPIFLSLIYSWLCTNREHGFICGCCQRLFGSMSFTGKTSRIESSLTMTRFVIVRLDSISGGFCLLNIGWLFPVLSLGFHRRLNCRGSLQTCQPTGLFLWVFCAKDCSRTRCAWGHSRLLILLILNLRT